jgi:putative PIN family toxin of toxin-antitoxin system
VRRVVLDTSVLVSALVGDGPPSRLRREIRQGDFELILSPLLLDELEEVLTRPKFRRYIDLEDVAEYLDQLRRDGSHFPDPTGPAPFRCDDPDDDYLVALAFHQKAIIVTGDKHLLDLGGRGAPIVMPVDLVGQPA